VLRKARALFWDAVERIFGRFTSPMRDQRCLEEVPGCTDVSPFGHADVDELARTDLRPVHIAPSSGDHDVGLANEPPIPNAVAAGSGCVAEHGWFETLYPAVDGDVVNLDAAFGE
jgi:hypothetical protein